jgi:GNAT superfamily N-acetyltransferase
MTAAMAVSDRGLPSGIVARFLREDDLGAALALSQKADWNQIAADWRIFLELGRVIGLTRGDGRLVATAAMLPYGRDFAWISMVLVTASERRQGLARWLLRNCIDQLLARNLVPLLDATPAGRAVYIGLGFQDCWTMRRLVANTVRESSIAYDKAVFGADRSALLHRLANRLPAAALVAEHRGRINGYVFGRDGRNMSQLGPLAAGHEPVAIALLTQAISRVPPPLVIDLPDHHASFGEWLSTLGFGVERPLTRMAYGRPKAFDDSARLFTIAGPELG